MAKGTSESEARALIFQLSTIKFYRIPLDGLDQFAVSDDEVEGLLENRPQEASAQQTAAACFTQALAPMTPYPGSVARVGPFAGSVARVGPFAGSVARLGPFAGSVQRVGPFAGSAAKASA